VKKSCRGIRNTCAIRRRAFQPTRSSGASRRAAHRARNSDFVRVIFTPLAERHIDSLHEYIAMHASEERADGYVGRIVDFCNGLSTFPLRGTQRDDLLSGLRVTGFERRVTIAFIVTAEAVLIEGIFYGGRDFEAEFRDRT
jgi:toxin ParE1/3/4